MPTMEQIEGQIKGLDGCSRFLGKKEIKELPNILWEDENVEKIVQGLYGNGLGILTATNKRLVFIDKGLMWGLKVEDFPYDKISSIQYETGIMFGEITIFTSGNKAKIQQVDKQQARDLCEYVRARISGIKEHASAPKVTPPDNDIITQLERLAKLKDSGALTEEEFVTAKRKLIG